MQSLYEAKIGWDDTIPEPCIAQWRKLVLTLQPMTLLRCYLYGVNDDPFSSVATVIPHMLLLLNFIY